jgi:ABC-2 type transport system ATP-binding protein
LIQFNIAKKFLILEGAIYIQDLTKCYYISKVNNLIALDKVSFNIAKGSCCALLGPNGAGKSTLINILASVTKKTSGQVKIANLDLDYNDNAIKWKIGIVPQEICLDVFFSVQDILRITAGYYNVSYKEEKIEKLLKSLKLWDKRFVKIRQLSGGMKKRLAIAKALLHDPEVLVLDEPTAGVDIDLREQIYEYIRQLKNDGRTILITTHYLHEASTLCDRFIFINKGKILADGLRDTLLTDSKEVSVKFANRIDNIESYFDDYQTSFSEDKKTVLIYLRSNQPLHILLNFISSFGENVTEVQSNSLSLEKLYTQIIN